MQEAAAASSPTRSSTFASLFAGFVVPGANSAPSPIEDGLEDDIATLSYEQALRTHARYHPMTASQLPAEREDLGGQQRKSGAASIHDANTNHEASSAAGNGLCTDQRQFAGEPAKAARRRPAAAEESRKSASITIRLSQAECAQVRERSAEAGLTISAYLRSCTLEVESLRAQVKETLAELRTAGEAAHVQGPSAGGRLPSSSWLARLFRRWNGQGSVARA